jgi:Zn-dependent protease
MKYALYLGRILGVKIYIHWTFVFLIAWVVITGLENDAPGKSVLWISLLIVAVFSCVILHELSHAVVARRFNILTKHITLLPIGGIAQLESLPQKPEQELLIAVAGPASNLLVAAALLPFVDMRALAESESLTSVNITTFLFTLLTINVWLAIFNLVPAFPMDGGRMLRAVLAFWIDYMKATKIAAYIGQAFGTVFFFAGFLYNPMLIFIGLLVFLGGQYEYAMVDTMRLLESFRIQDVLMHEIPTMSNRLTVEEAGKQLLNTQNRNFVVVDHDSPVGTINRDEIIKASYQNRDKILIDEIKNEKLTFVELTLALNEAWKMIHEQKISVLLVKCNGHLDGMLDEENLTEFIQLKSGDKLK